MKYHVTIQATVTKTITVNARTEKRAVEMAHEQFTVTCDNGPESSGEDYDEQTLSVERAGRKGRK